jgi:magnesium transporter
MAAVEHSVEHSLVWRDGKAQADLSPAGVQAAARDTQARVWLDIEGDAAPHLHMLATTFGLSRITLDSITEEAERARFIEGHGYFYIVNHALTFHSETQEAETPKIDIIFGHAFLITVHRASLPWLDRLRASLGRGELEENVLSRGIPYLLHAVLDSLVDSYFPVLDEIDDVIDELEDETVRTVSSAVQARIFRMKRALALMRRVISPQVEVANACITRTGEYIPREAEPYFAEIHDHLVRAFEVIDSYRDLMSGLLDVYLTTVSNRQNEVMKQLTIIASIFLPITFVTGVFGMNFGHSPQVEHDTGANFWLALLAMALITAVQIWYFRRRGWI